ncbi:protein of unknown function [Candidatus Hydrogenisulfobacillus filiaventi]|uniref:Uncharacterized protein n=1 Tax=Candidatus Hydrogenisulfobacillus filiaventi TaxID=2707344 RepID=A0A6F8ZIC5_9FIRM|nr:protein of unknown function [Candidatus Hydrogenisulfobacillus filiaventi]
MRRPRPSNLAQPDGVAQKIPGVPSDPHGHQRPADGTASDPQFRQQPAGAHAKADHGRPSLPPPLHWFLPGLLAALIAGFGPIGYAWIRPGHVVPWWGWNASVPLGLALLFVLSSD